VKPVGKLDAGNRPVQFDERGGETDRSKRHRASPRLYTGDPEGFVRSRASKVFVGDVAARGSESGGFEDPEDSDRAAELAQSPAIGGDMLAMEGSDTQKTPELIERTAES
jgi:hypothetical protein